MRWSYDWLPSVLHKREDKYKQGVDPLGRNWIRINKVLNFNCKHLIKISQRDESGLPFPKFSRVDLM